MSGYLSALLGPFLGSGSAFESVGPDWTARPPIVPAAVEELLATEDPMPSDVVSGGRDLTEPEHLRWLRARVERAEAERDLVLSALIAAECHYASQQPKWAVEA